MKLKTKKSKQKALVLLVIAFLSFTPSAYAFKAGAHAVLSSEVANSLPQNSIIKNAMLQYPEIAAWGATGPDVPANSWGIVVDDSPWFERYHYEKVGSYAKEQLRLALQSGDPKKIAWAAGWVTHVVGDLYCHGIFVNPDPEVGGVYLANPDTKEMHGQLEAWADKVLFEDKSNPKKSYIAQNMQSVFHSFDSQGVRNLMCQASQNVYGKNPGASNIADWMDFFKSVYLDTGVAGGSNWVYDNTYSEASQHLQGGTVSSGEFAGMNRIQRLNRAYDEAKNLSASLLNDAEESIYSGFSDAWNLDAYHHDNRSIGTLTVNIRTADVLTAGTDDDVRFGLVLDNGEEWTSGVLDKGSGLLGLGTVICNDFERGSNDDYYMFVDRTDFPINKIKKVFLRKSGDNLGGGWKVEGLTVWINGVPYFDGTINTWLQNGHLRWEGDVMPVLPERIPVLITADANALTNVVSGKAYMNGEQTAYQGNVTIHVQHKDKDNSVENFNVNTGADGSFTYNTPLKPDDLVQVNIYKPQDNNPNMIYIGSTALKNPTVPYEDITFTADAFNDIVKGQVSGNYTGPVQIVVRNESKKPNSRVIQANANKGQFSKTVTLTGGDTVFVRVLFEGVYLPRVEIFKEANLDALTLEYNITGNDSMNGMIYNTAGSSAAAYVGNVKLSAPKNEKNSVTVKAVAIGNQTSNTVLKSKNKAKTISSGKSGNTSKFAFKKVTIPLRLAYILSIEHEGIVKSISYDSTENVNQAAQKPQQGAVTSPIASVVDPVINPVDSTLNPVSSAANTQSSQMQMMPTTSSNLPWNGVWETNFGSMILTRSGNTVTGIYGDNDSHLQGTVSGNSLKGTFDEGEDNKGEFEFALFENGESFKGRFIYIGQDDDWSDWSGKRISEWNGAGSTIGAQSWEGVWFTDFGSMVLKQDGTKFSAVYGANKNKLEGTVQDGTLKGTFTEGSSKGEFEFTMYEDGKSFVGKYRNTSDEDWQDWNGSKKTNN